MSGLRFKDVFLYPDDFDPKAIIEPFPISRNNVVWRQEFSGEDFRYIIKFTIGPQLH